MRTLSDADALTLGINAGRKTIPFARFDAKRCAPGLEALLSYRVEWDEKARAFKKTPEHNWASHGADAWRYLCLGALPCASRHRRVGIRPIEASKAAIRNVHNVNSGRLLHRLGAGLSSVIPGMCPRPRGPLNSCTSPLTRLRSTRQTEPLAGRYIPLSPLWGMPASFVNLILAPGAARRAFFMEQPGPVVVSKFGRRILLKPKPRRSAPRRAFPASTRGAFLGGPPEHGGARLPRGLSRLSRAAGLFLRPMSLTNG